MGSSGGSTEKPEVEFINNKVGSNRGAHADLIVYTLRPALANADHNKMCCVLASCGSHTQNNRSTLSILGEMRCLPVR